MVKRKKFLRNGRFPSEIRCHATKRQNRARIRILRARLTNLCQELKEMLSQRQAEVDTGNDPGGNGKGGGSSNEAVTPGSFSNGEGSKEFLSTGRTGRRNALPHILGQHAETGTSDLSNKFETLTIEEQHNQAGPSGLGQSEAHCSQQHSG